MNFDEARVDQGWEDAWLAYEPGEPVGDPVGADESYDLGWWSGIGCCAAWHEGWAAAENGLCHCPYDAESDEECFRGHWLNGYAAALGFAQKAVHG